MSDSVPEETPDPQPPSYLRNTRTGLELTELVRTYRRGDLGALTAEIEAKDVPALRALLKAAVVTMSTEGVVG